MKGSRALAGRLERRPRAVLLLFYENGVDAENPARGAYFNSNHGSPNTVVPAWVGVSLRCPIRCLKAVVCIF